MTRLPSLHNRWIGEVLDSDIPEEPYCTCDRCPMCEPDGVQTVRGVRRFSQDTKCCTYWPVLPNYLAGSVLADRNSTSEHGRARISALLTTGLATPRGIGVADEYQAVYTRSSTTGFGRSSELRCPYFQVSDGSCSIWHHRNGVCSTWYCKPRRGAVGEAFWDAMQSCLTTVEKTLSLWCALQLRIPLHVARRVPRGAEDLYAPRAGQHKSGTSVGSNVPLWGAWNNRRDAFYQSCFGLAHELEWKRVQQLGGLELETEVLALREAHRRNLERTAASRVIAAPLTILRRTATTVVVHSYRESDPQAIDAKVFNSLRHAQGTTVDELCRKSLDEDGVGLTHALVERLVDVRVLLPVD